MFLSRHAAVNAALHAVHYEGRADHFIVRQRRERQSDRSFEQGWQVLLFRRGRFIGCAIPA